MILSISHDALLSYVVGQINTFFPDGFVVEKAHIEDSFDVALTRLEKCFKHVIIPGYKKDGETYFNHLHSDQYTQFLYFLANQIWKDGGDELICSKITNLIRLLSGMFVTYKCGLPEIFIFIMRSVQ